jgi:hypothetical protein
VIYSLLGAAFAAVVNHRVPRSRVMLLSVVSSLVWYYLSFRWAFKTTMPLVALLHVERSTMLGHLLYGTMLGRYPVYVQRLLGPPDSVAALEEGAAVAADAAVAEGGALVVGAPVAEGAALAAGAPVAEGAALAAGAPVAEEAALAAGAPVAEGAAVEPAGEKWNPPSLP